MAIASNIAPPANDLGFFERYLTLWVVLCIIGGICLGKLAPGLASFLDRLALYVNDAPVVSLPIAVCLFFMMYPIMVKIDFGEVLRTGRNLQPVSLTLVINWVIKPFTMYAISVYFLGHILLDFIGPEAVDYVKMPLGLDLPVGAVYGSGNVVLVNGVRCFKSPYGAAIWRVAFCLALLRARRWCWCGATSPVAMMATLWSWLRLIH